MTSLLPSRCFSLSKHHFRLLQTMAKHKRPNRPSAQKKPPLTHFLCLPLVTPTSKPKLEASLAKFRNEVAFQVPSADATDETDDTVLPFVHPKAIRPVGALHCTLGVMSLKQEELDAAIELLNGLDVPALLRGASDLPASEEGPTAAKQPADGPTTLERPISPPQVERLRGPLTIALKGLQSMHDPQKTSILYAAPSDASNRLYNFCLALQKTFKDKDLLVEDNRALKLHATIVNTIYAKGRKRPQRQVAGSGASPNAQREESTHAAGVQGTQTGDDRTSGHGPNANAPLKINATQILGQYKDFVWAENVILDRVAICEMGAKKILDEKGNVKAEEYTEVASLALPT